MSRQSENSSFICAACGHAVNALTNGSYRNHCPKCLCSLHVDVVPGDRKSECGGIMRPVSVIYNPKKGYQILHRCEKCGHEQLNRIADSTDDPDDIDEVIRIMKQSAQ